MQHSLDVGYIFPKNMRRFLALAAFVCLTVTIFSKTTHAKSDAFLRGNIEVRFSFFPSIFSENLSESTEPVFLIIRTNGEAKVVNYGLYFRSDNIVVHQGKLSKDYIAGLIVKAQKALVDASRIRRYEGGLQDESIFYLSVGPLNKRPAEQPAIEYLGLLGQPDSVRALVSELRMLWKKLKKLKPAYAYVRLESTGKVSPDFVKTDPRFKSIQTFPSKLQSILINAIKNPLQFYALTRLQISQLSKFISPRSLLCLIYNGYGYGLNLFMPRIAQRDPIKSKTDIQEIRFGFYYRFRDESSEDLFMTLRENGDADALKYDDDRRIVTVAYKGTLPETEITRLVARVQEAFRETSKSRPRDERLITEGNLFYLAMKTKSGAIKEMGRKVGDVPEGVQRLINDLNVLWKQLKEAPRAAGYVRSMPIDKERFESLQQNNLIRFTTIEEFPSDVQQIVAGSISQPYSFKALSQAQYDKLRVQKNLAVKDNGSGYSLSLFSSRNNAAPHK